MTAVMAALHDRQHLYKLPDGIANGIQNWRCFIGRGGRARLECIDHVTHETFTAVKAEAQAVAQHYQVGPHFKGGGMQTMGSPAWQWACGGVVVTAEVVHAAVGCNGASRLVTLSWHLRASCIFPGCEVVLQPRHFHAGKAASHMFFWMLLRTLLEDSLPLLIRLICLWPAVLCRASRGLQCPLHQTCARLWTSVGPQHHAPACHAARHWPHSPQQAAR